jgi:hypothetical protein
MTDTLKSINELDNLVGEHPSRWLLHGPTKTLLDNYHWHSPDAGIVGSYTPTEFDVNDHFGLFRGVDQIEAFAQATIVSCGTFSECKKQNREVEDLRKILIPAFISTGPVYFHNYLEVGETFVSLGIIKFYKFRQMVCDGRIYKVPKDLNLDDYFSSFDEKRLLNYDLSADFKLVAELFDITGRALKAEMFKTP